MHVLGTKLSCYAHAACHVRVISQLFEVLKTITKNAKQQCKLRKENSSLDSSSSLSSSVLDFLILDFEMELELVFEFELEHEEDRLAFKT